MPLMAVSQGRQNLLFLYFCALRHKMQPLSPHLECTRVGRLPKTNNLSIKTHDLWVLRQYFPSLPFASLYTGSLHPGVAQIPDIVEAERCDRGLCVEEAWVNWLARRWDTVVVIQ